jgi:hypothetical protein
VVMTINEDIKLAVDRMARGLLSLLDIIHGMDEKLTLLVEAATKDPVEGESLTEVLNRLATGIEANTQAIEDLPKRLLAAMKET